MNYDIEFLNNIPHVTLHEGYRLTKRFRLSETKTAPIRKLLVDGDGNSKMRKNGKDHYIKSYG